MKNDKSLLSLFYPPDKTLKGQIGFLCGYSASEDFLDRALENFNTCSKQQRYEQGLLSLVLFLDKRCNPITSVAGLQQEMFAGQDNSFSLMHAKVGLLAFAKNKFSDIEVIRLFVSTGNWTRQGMLENLDHVWKLDVNLKTAKTKDLLEARKVINFFIDLSQHYPLLTLSQQQLNKLDHLIPAATEAELQNTKFFSTFDTEKNLPLSMLQGIKKRMRKDRSSKPFNTIICGSGFYEEVDESTTQKTKELKVFNEIQKNLCDSNNFTNKVSGFVVANKNDYAKFKSTINQNQELSWKLYAIRDPLQKNLNLVRHFLHSKYIFSGAKFKSGYPSAKIYLGSANLSKKGLLYNLKNPEANIEAGVVIDVSGITEQEVDDWLCISKKPVDEAEIENSTLNSENEFTDNETIFAAPIKALTNYDWQTNTADIEWGPTPKDCYFNLNNKRYDIFKDKTNIQINEEATLGSQLTVFSTDTNESFIIPIITSDGKFCAHPPEQVGAESILNLLLVFPDSISGSDEDEDDSVITVMGSLNSNQQNTGPTSVRLLNLAMELVEQIARKNQELTIEQLPVWQERLVFTLTRCLAKNEKAGFQKIAVNFLDVLKEPHFSPNWQKLAAHDDQIQSYNLAIDTVAQDWGIKTFNSIKAAQHV